MLLRFCFLRFLPSFLRSFPSPSFLPPFLTPSLAIIPFLPLPFPSQSRETPHVARWIFNFLQITQKAILFFSTAPPPTRRRKEEIRVRICAMGSGRMYELGGGDANDLGKRRQADATAPTEEVCNNELSQRLRIWVS